MANELIERLNAVLFLPPAPDAILWRYMNFTKFMSLLEEKALYLSRADCLGDPFECSYPPANAEYYKTFEFHVPDVDRDRNPDEYEAGRRQIAENNNKFFVEMSQDFARSVFVNCWHQSDHESDAMWGMYLKGADGVAIRTTAKRLSDSINAITEVLDLGTVRYIDYEEQRLDETNAFNLVLHKRHFYAHEREVRVIHWNREPIPADGPKGMLAAADLQVLIDKIVVSPTVQGSFQKLLVKILKRYELNVRVEPSKMADKPLM